MTSPSSTVKKNLLKNASWLFGGGMGGSLFAMAEVVILTRFLGLEQFGLFSIVVAYVRIVKGLLDFKVNETVIKYLGRHLERKEKGKALSFIKLFYLIDFFTGVVAFLTAVLLTGVANKLFIKSDVAFDLVLIYALSILIATVNTTSRAILEVFKKFSNVALVDMLSVAVRALLVFASLAAGYGIKGALVAYVAAAFIHFLVLQFLVNRVLVYEGLKRWFTAAIAPAAKEIKGVTLFILSSTVSNFLSKVFTRDFPILVLGHFFTSEISGLYKTATTFSKIWGKLKSPAGKVIYPTLVSLEEQGSYEVFKQVVSYSVKFLLKILVPVGVVFFVFAETIIGIFFGSEYLPAANAMRIIVVAEVLSSIYLWLPPAYLALGKIWLRAGLTFVSALIYAAALFYLAPLYSLEGAAFAKLLPYLVLLPAAAFLFRDLKKRSKEKHV